MNKDLTVAREEITQADRQIAKYFEKRMNAVAKVAAYKKEFGLPIEDKEQEAKVIERNTSFIENKDLESGFLSLTQCLIDESKKYQFRLNEGLKIAYNGTQGAFAYIAAKRVFPKSLLMPYGSFGEAYASVESGECDIAMLPIENSSAGEVGQVIDLMYSGALSVNGIYSLPVTHNLIGTQDASLENIEVVISHPQALAQCDAFIKQHNLRTITASSTAEAVKYVSIENNSHLAAIGSEESADLSGLKVIRSNINESRENTTRFAVFSRAAIPEANIGKDSKFILMFTVNDEAGALVKALNVIGEYGFNMQVLRSRPVKDKAWQYYFYTEVEGDCSSPGGIEMLDKLRGQCETIKTAGHYSESGVLKA